MPHANQVLVAIAVQNKRLSMYPRRWGEVVLYCKGGDPKGEPRSPEKPRELCWMVTDRDGRANRKIQIKSKNPSKSPFSRSDWEIPVGSGKFVESGPLLTCPTEGQLDAWHYEVSLMEGDTRLDYIDPTVVIKTDP